MATKPTVPAKGIQGKPELYEGKSSEKSKKQGNPIYGNNGIQEVGGLILFIFNKKTRNRMISGLRQVFLIFCRAALPPPTGSRTRL